MAKGIFITGTDTGVGKTIITGALAAILNEAGLNVGVMKPVASGCTLIDDRMTSQDTMFLKDASNVTDDLELITPYSLKEPIAPVSSARIEGVSIDLEKIRLCYKKLAKNYELILVEGVGGLMVPLNDKQMVADLVRYLNLPILVVVDSKLGAINHTLLTVNHARVLGIEVIGIIINNTKRINNKIRLSNKREIEEFSYIPIWGEIPYCKNYEDYETLIDTVNSNLAVDIVTQLIGQI